MKRIILICVSIFAVLGCLAQEKPSITQTLDKRYGWACYHDTTNGGWYGIKKDGKEGACDLQGNEVIPPIWDDVYFGGTYYEVKKDGKVGIRDLQNNEIIPANKYDDIKYYQMQEYGYCKVVINGKIGILSKELKEIVPCKYDDVSITQLLGEQIFKVKYNGKCGIFDIVKQKEIIPADKYDDIKYYQMRLWGCCEVVINGKIGILSKELKEIVPCKYDDVSITQLSGEQICEVKYNGKCGIFDIVQQKEIIPCKYISLQLADTDLWTFNVGGNKQEDTVTGGKWGCIDKSDKIVIPAEYDTPISFHDGIAQVSKNSISSFLQHPLKGSSLTLANGVTSNEVDNKIPQTNKDSKETFAFVFANENYTNFSGADYSINDGKIFTKYCKKTLGLPENNVRYYEDATYGNMQKVIKQIQDIADVYDGSAKIIFYFSGLGISNDKDGKRYILPSDASASALSATAVPLADLLRSLGKLNTIYTMAVVDAPFNGMDKNGKALGTGRGVKINDRNEDVFGNMVLLVGNENGNNYSSKSLGHGLLTYSLLNQLKETKGDCSVGSLIENITTDTKKESLNQFKDVQKPLIKVSEQIKNKIQSLKL